MSAKREEMLNEIEKTMGDIRSSYYWETIEERPNQNYDITPNEFGAALFGDMTPNQVFANWVNPDVTNEQFAPIRDQINAGYEMGFKAMMDAHPEWAEKGFLEEYTNIPGCPEEPDTPVERVLVYRLKEEYKPGPHPVMFIPSCNGFFISAPESVIAPAAAHFLGCDVVVPKYRSFVDAPYPARINDYHATYQWMVDNAEKLNIDLDRIIIAGASGSGTTGPSFAFRLKRYNWCGAPMPRGIFVIDGLWDERETTPSQRIMGTSSFAQFCRGISRKFMGNAYGSQLVGPEAMPSRATIEECKGLPPFLIYASQDFWGADPAKEFATKLTAAGVWCSFMQLGGTPHGGPIRKEDNMVIDPTSMNFNASELVPSDDFNLYASYERFAYGGMRELFANDYRRLWKWEE